MAYIKLDTKQKAEAQDIINAFPEVTFPSTSWSDELLQPYGFAVLHSQFLEPLTDKYLEYSEAAPYQEDGKWYNGVKIQSIIPEDPNELAQFIEAEKQKLRTEITQTRYGIEIEGIEYNGYTIPSDRQSQAQLANTYIAMKSGLINSTHWKINEGTWIELDIAAIEQICGLVAAHVSKVFTKERQLIEQVSSISTMAEIAAFNINYSE